MGQQQIKGDTGPLGSGGELVTYVVPGSALVTPYSVSAVFDGSGASGSFIPCLTFKTITGAIIARCPAPEVAAGDGAEVSWFPHVAAASKASGTLTVEDNGVAVGMEPAINMVDGSGITWSTADDPADSRVNISAVVSASVSGILATVFGTGSDGALSLTQSSSAPSWATKGGSGASTTFQLSRDLYATSFHLDNSNGPFTLITRNYRIFCSDITTGMLIDSGITAGYSGSSSGGNIPGGALGAGTLPAGLSAGGTGGTGGAAGGTTTSASASATVNALTTPKHGGTGGSATGGPGTGGGATPGTASYAAGSSSPDTWWAAQTMYSMNNISRYTAGCAGSGGSSAGNPAQGGGGGSAGGYVIISAAKLTNNGTIAANGGNGGPGGLFSTGTGAGGGGGGMGGVVALCYIGSISTPGTVTVTGGTGGNAAGTGKTGGNGDDGQIYSYPF